MKKARTKKTVYNHNLLSPDYITARIGNHKIKVTTRYNGATYKDACEKIAQWSIDIWEAQEVETLGLFYEPLYLYYDINWDADNILYCKYDCLELVES